MKRTKAIAEYPQLHIQVIGVNAGGVKELPGSLISLILSAKKIAGSKRVISSLKEWWETQNIANSLPELFESNDSNQIIHWLKAQSENVILLSSGDALWFGIGRLLIEHFSKKIIDFYPSPTSLQLAFSKLGIPWHEAEWISLHGRDPEPLKKLLQKRVNLIGILTDPNRGGAEEVRQFLKALGLEKNYAFWIFEKLGHKDESFKEIDCMKPINVDIDPLHLVVLIKENNKSFNQNDIPLFGIEDGVFLQHSDRPGLMTKREIRIQILSDLELPTEGIIWDIGAGVGSIGIEALRIRPKLKLLSLEKRIGGKELIQKNAIRLSVKPTKIVEAEAYEFIRSNTIPSNLLKPNRVILGGGGDKRNALLVEILKKMQKGGIIVIPLTNIESIKETKEILNNHFLDFKISQHQSYRGVQIANGTRFSPMNPVFIIKAKF